MKTLNNEQTNSIDTNLIKLSDKKILNEDRNNAIALQDHHHQQQQQEEIPSQLINNARITEEVTTPTAKILDNETDVDGLHSCGFGWWRPKWLQRFLSVKFFLFWMCWAGAMQGLVVNGFVNVVITTIERRYGLRSTQTGLVASGYDIASFLCLVPTTYFGGRSGASKPRWIGWGVVVMGLGSLVFSLPQFLVEQYRASGDDSNVCQIGNGTHQGCSTVDDLGNAHPDMENLSWNVWFFLLAQLLHGAGAAPLFTLGVTFIDENVTKKMSSVYLGIYYTMAIIGPAVGYILGGQMLLLYTDFLTVDVATLGLTPQSKLWVGAWWIGFLGVALSCMILAIPLLAFPAALPGSEKIKQLKESEAHHSVSENQQFTKIREIPKALLSLLRNPAFFFLSMAGAAEGMVISGLSVFLPKLIENQFSMTAVMAAMYMGLITVPGGGGGTFLGGYLVKKLNLSCSDIIKLCLVAASLAATFTLAFFLWCPNLQFAGVTAPYFPQVAENWQGMGPDNNLHHICNTKCSCPTSAYEPICGADGVIYYSPCHAGCLKEMSFEANKVYQDCLCIQKDNNTDGLFGNYDAVNTMCESTCQHLGVFASLLFIAMTFTFMSTMPALSATLRCVHEDQRSFALGIQWMFCRVLGTIPAPLIFGVLIDKSCILWQDSCEGQGSCLMYDNKYMSRYMLAVALIAKGIGILFYYLAWWSYKPPKKIKADTKDETETNGHINPVLETSREEIDKY